MCLSIWELLHLIEKRGTATCLGGPMALRKGLQSFKTRGEKPGDWLSLKAKWSKRNLKGEGMGWQTSRKSTKNTASIIHCFITLPCGPILVLHLIYMYLYKWREVVTPRCHGNKISEWQQFYKRHSKGQFAVFQTTFILISCNLSNIGEIFWGRIRKLLRVRFFTNIKDRIKNPDH